MLNVVVFHRDGARYAALVASAVPGVRVALARDEAALRRALRDADVLLTFEFPVALLADAPRLRWIQVTSAGTEFLADAKDSLARIVVTNGRGIHAAPIADYVMTAAVMLHSDLPGFWRAQAAHRWERRPVHPLAGKTLGVTGLGSIGGEIARRAVAAGMRVLGVRRSGLPVAGVDRVYAPAGLRTFLGECDFVVVVVPMTPQTRAMLGRDELAAMRRGAYLINVARGSVVDEPALIDALRGGHLGGACLDVFDTEPLPQHSPLWDLPNVIVTPHIAGMRADYEARLVEIFAENVRRLEAGRELVNRVDLARGY